MRAALVIARAILRIVPSSQAGWASAMASEIMHAKGRGARRFALGCLGAAVALRAEAIGEDAMTMVRAGSERPRTTAAGCGVAASLAGLVYLAATDAPVRMLASHAAAIPIGLLAFAIAAATIRGAGGIVLASGAALLVTALSGVSLEGAARWARIGSVAIQPSLVLLPAAILLHLRHRSRTSDAGMAVAAVAMALQPDRAMAGVLLLSLLAAGPRAGRLATLAAAGAFAVTLFRPDTLPAAPWVDGVLVSAIGAGLVPGAAVIGGTAILLLPALFGLREGDATTRAFGACWIAIVAAAAMGNYPTPLVGYGGSAILGYLLAAGVLPRRTAAARDGSAATPFEAPMSDALLRTR